ncbi:hypothetical protein SLS62_009627 [Diatrype stigma]|uniref:BZIP domain-containing protein n=1 Tax=Diatrype stigma TaxID=117547 RepID=A0AAN9YIV2_9PEZI
MTPKRAATDDIYHTDKRARTASSSNVSGTVPRHDHALPAIPPRPHARIQSHDEDEDEDVHDHPAESAAARAAHPKRGRWAGLTLDGDLSEGERQRRVALNNDLLEQRATHNRERNTEAKRRSRQRRADLIAKLQADNARLEALVQRLQAEASEREQREGEGEGGESLCARCRAAVPRVPSIDDEIEELLLGVQQQQQQHRHQQHHSPPPLDPLAPLVAAADVDLVGPADPDLIPAYHDLQAQPNNLLAGGSLDMQLWNNSPAGEGVGEEAGHVEAGGFWEGFDWTLGTWGGGGGGSSGF